MEQLLLRVEEGAEMLRIGRSKLYQMLATGTVPSIRFGRSIRIPADALRRWVEERSVTHQGGNG